MITIYINNETHQIEPTLTLDDLLQQHQQSQPFAVALNFHLVQRHLYPSTFLSPADRVDIIVPMQGG